MKTQIKNIKKNLKINNTKLFLFIKAFKKLKSKLFFYKFVKKINK